MPQAKSLVALVLSTAMAGVPTIGAAYNQDTHKILADQAFQISDAKGSGLFTDLTAVAPLLPITSAAADLALQAGANNEDTWYTYRSANHFFNPITGAALTFPQPATHPVTVQNYASPDWIITGTGQGGVFAVTTLGPLYYPADRHFYNALNGEYLAALTAPDTKTRSDNATELFTDLGHVIHHIQDMAQPQHTRNDEHCDTPGVCEKAGLQVNYSEYERYASTQNAKIPTLSPTPIIPIYSRAKPNGAFATVRDFWKSGPSPGMGMAEYSNHYYISEGTNFAACATPPGYCPYSVWGTPSTFANPAPTDTTLVLESVPPSTNLNQTYVESLTLPVALASQAFISAGSVFSTSLTTPDAFVTNPTTRLAALSDLVPRAISYSAGIMNFFFRGNIDASVNPSTNTIVISNLGTQELNGRFELFFDNASTGMRETANLVWTGALAANFPTDTGFSVPEVTSVTPGEFTLVYSGSIGGNPAETIVAGKNVSLVPTLGGQVTVTIIGVVGPLATDYSGVFLDASTLPVPPYGDLTGLPFTLVYSIDTTKGLEATISNGSGGLSSDSIQYSPSSGAPVSATLTINGRSITYVYAVPPNIGVPETSEAQITYFPSSGELISYNVEADSSGIGSNGVAFTFTTAGGIAPPIAIVNIRTPLAYTFQPTDNPIANFVVNALDATVPGGQASGTLVPSAISIQVH